MSKRKKIKETTEIVDDIDSKQNFPWGSLILAILCVIYLLNPLSGVDLLPDALPIIGNLDEMGVTLLLIRSLRKIKGNIK